MRTWKDWTKLRRLCLSTTATWWPGARGKRLRWLLRAWNFWQVALRLGNSIWGGVCSWAIRETVLNESLLDVRIYEGEFLQDCRRIINRHLIIRSLFTSQHLSGHFPSFLPFLPTVIYFFPPAVPPCNNLIIQMLFIRGYLYNRLIICGWRGVSDHSLLPILINCKNLSQLDLLGIKSITADVCETALMHLPKLRLLEVSFCDSIRNEQVEFVFRFWFVWLMFWIIGGGLAWEISAYCNPKKLWKCRSRLLELIYCFVETWKYFNVIQMLHIEVAVIILLLMLLVWMNCFICYLVLHLSWSRGRK